MKRIRKAGLCALVLVLLGAYVYAADFSADLYAGGTDGKTTAAAKKVGRIYVAGKMIRQEIEMSPDQRMISIIRLDKNKVWLVNAKTKEYAEMPIRNAALADPRSDAAYANQTVKKNLGTEKVSGYTCQKTEYVSKESADQKVIRWYSSKLAWPVKIQFRASGGKLMTQELRNVKEGKQSGALFEIPKGYKKTEMPKAPPKGDPKATGKPRK